MTIFSPRFFLQTRQLFTGSVALGRRWWRLCVSVRTSPGWVFVLQDLLVRGGEATGAILLVVREDSGSLANYYHKTQPWTALSWFYSAGTRDTYPPEIVYYQWSRWEACWLNLVCVRAPQTFPLILEIESFLATGIVNCSHSGLRDLKKPPTPNRHHPIAYWH